MKNWIWTPETHIKAEHCSKSYYRWEVETREFSKAWGAANLMYNIAVNNEEALPQTRWKVKTDTQVWPLTSTYMDAGGERERKREMIKNEFKQNFFIGFSKEKFQKSQNDL